MTRIVRAGRLWAALLAASAIAAPACRKEATAPAAQETPSPAASTGERKIAYYRNPMDPSVHSDRPTKDSMGMDFVPVYADELEGAASTVPGRAVVTLSPERRQMLGVRSEAVKKIRLERTIRTVGRVTPDERRLHHIHTKVEGFIEHIYVDFIGKLVNKGDPLVALYSPELFATQQEYLLAYRAKKQLEASGIPSVAKGGVDLLAAARERLLLWDIRPEDIDALEKSGKATRTLDLYSDISGYVVQKMALHGMRVTPVDTLFDIADLSQLWVLADVYEADLPSVHLGMQAELTVPYRSGRSWRGPVTYIDPSVDEKTRTIKVRIEISNMGLELKPEMFADVFLKSDLGFGVVVPESAVINAGDRQLVFLDRQDGRLEPREVKLGAKLGNEFQVLRGLSEGERVVISANFLLDSESSLKAALGAMATPAPSPSGHQH